MFRLALTLLFLLFSLSGFANTSFTDRKDVQNFIEDTAKQYHLDKKELNATMNQVVIQPHIIESMNKPFEKKNWDVYKALFLTRERLEAGLKFWQDNHVFLTRVEKRYQVPPEIIIAILGVETLFGTRQGEYRVLDALATLAFNYPKRAPYFTSELKEYLLLCQEQKRSPTYFIGSYAGAIGQPQFMPSSYRRYAVDLNNKGNSDLVHDTGDVIASVANYLHRYGWKNQEAIAIDAHIKKDQYASLLTNPKFPNYPYYKLKKSASQSAKVFKTLPRKAGLIELNTEKGNEYWIAFPNFFVLTHYNSSPQYALVVYLLSQQLKNEWHKSFQKGKA